MNDLLLMMVLDACPADAFELQATNHCTHLCSIPEVCGAPPFNLDGPAGAVCSYVTCNGEGIRTLTPDQPRRLQLANPDGTPVRSVSVRQSFLT